MVLMTSTETQERYRTAGVVGHFTAAEHNESKTCDCCGQGIVHINAVRLASGETVFLGNDCVERVGLSSAQLKAWWSQKFAEERHARQRARWAAADAEERAKTNGLPERDLVINYYLQAQAAFVQRGGAGDITTGGRIAESVYDDFCRDAVTTGAHLYHGGTERAIRVIGAAENADAFVRAPWRYVTDPARDLAYGRALFDLDGNLLDARLVEGRFGMVWRIEGGGWFNPSKARNAAAARANNARKGYYVGACKYRRAGNSARWWADTSEPPVVILDNGLVDELVTDRRAGLASP